MKKRILKYGPIPFHTNGEYILELNTDTFDIVNSFVGAKIESNKDIFIYASIYDNELSEKNEVHKLHLAFYGTGHEIDETKGFYHHLALVQDGYYVWHVMGRYEYANS